MIRTLAVDNEAAMQNGPKVAYRLENPEGWHGADCGKRSEDGRPLCGFPAGFDAFRYPGAEHGRDRDVHDSAQEIPGT